MKSFSSYLVVMFMGVFWILRVVAGISATFGGDIGIPVMNINYEIAIIFATFVCILLVAKRSIIGALAYIFIHGWYFGGYLYKLLMNIPETGIALTEYTGAILAFIGIVLPIIVLFEMLFDKNKQKHGGDKKTDWYYKGDEYDRKVDSRADKNNYRTM